FEKSLRYANASSLGICVSSVALYLATDPLLCRCLQARLRRHGRLCLRGARQPARRARLRLREQQLDDADAPLIEACLAVREVQPPHPSEALVVAQALELRRALEVRAPAPERLGVVGRQIPEPNSPHVRAPRETARDHLH